ncbi:MAG TPA: hypothetical protein VF851_08260 [Steroidobacteraceae bacterium]
MAAVWDVFHEAVRVLVGAGPVKQRLIEAYREHLAGVREQDVPDALRERLLELRAAMHSAPATGGMTAPEASVRKMSEQDAGRHATSILEMFAALGTSTEQEATPRLRIVGGEDHVDDEVPGFLSRA